MSDLAKIEIDDNFFVGNSASSGGAISIIQNSKGFIQNSRFIENTSYSYGGSVYGSGVEVDIHNNIFSDNKLLSNIGSNANESYGAGLFMATMDEKELKISGSVRNNIFSDNKGLPIYDRDNMKYPVNEIVYDGNSFYTTSFQGSPVYTNSNPNYCCKTVDELNYLIIRRDDGVIWTKKSISSDNTLLSSIEEHGALIGVPSELRFDLNSMVPGYVIFGWGGPTGIASFNEQPLIKKWGLTRSSNLHLQYHLGVRSDEYTTSVVELQPPRAILNKDSKSNELAWSVTGGTLLDIDIDQVGEDLPEDSKILNGKISTSFIYGLLEYRLFVITDRGGYVATPPKLSVSDYFVFMFDDDQIDKTAKFPLHNIGDGSLNCSISVVSSLENFSILNPEVEFSDFTNIEFRLTTSDKGQIDIDVEIDCEEGGNKSVNLRLIIVDQLFSNFLPLITK